MRGRPWHHSWSSASIKIKFVMQELREKGEQLRKTKKNMSYNLGLRIAEIWKEA